MHNTTKTVVFIFILSIVFVLTDSVYLYFTQRNFSKQIQNIQGSPMTVRLYSAVLCYIALVFGIYYFIIKDKRSILDAFFLGVVIYAVYETTSLALLKKWEPSIALIDTLWGGVLFAIVTFVMYKIEKIM